MPSSGSSGRKPPPVRKPAGKKPKKKGLPSPCPTPFSDVSTGEPYVFSTGAYPPPTTCIRFMMHENEDIPPCSLEFLLSVVRPLASKVHAVIHASHSLLFFVEVSSPESLEHLLAATTLQIPTTAFLLTATHDCIEVTIKDCLADLDMELGLENCPSDFSMPSTTDDDEEEPQPRKVARPDATKHVFAAVQPQPPTRAAKQPLPVVSVAEVPLRPAEPVAESPSSSLTCALPDSQPEASEPVAAATPSERRRRRFRYMAVDFSALKVDMPVTEPCLTLLIRPVSAADDLHKQNSQKVARDLGVLGEPTRVRDIRNGGLAVDFPTSTPQAPLLALACLAGCPVTCSLPVAAVNLSAVVSGVHPDISESDILADMVTSPPVKLLAVKRLARPGQLSWSVKITVEGTQLPERALLYGRSRRVAAFSNKPLQCKTCGRFGHSSGVCRSSLRCWTCGQPHETSSCPSRATPSCPNCGGSHPADAIHCPARQLEAKVCQVQAAHQSSFRSARVAVEKAAKSYAAAAKAAPRAPALHNRPPPLVRQPDLAGGFLASTPHHRPSQPPDFHPLVSLFRGILTILTAAIASNDLSAALKDVAALFQTHVPGADPSVFSV